MILVRLWNFLRGYVIINVNGYFIEKFINLCASKGIYLWDIQRKPQNNMFLKVSIKGFKKLRGISKKTRCKVRIQKKVGYPFIKHRYRKRKSFVLGFLAFVVVIYILTSFIWVIEINGIDKLSSQRIIDFLDQNGVKPGTIKYKIDKTELVPKMLINIDEIAWADISVIGTKVVVNIKERIPSPQILDTSTPCSIFATKNGVIQNIMVKNGTPQVKKGQLVQKGQILISGVVDNKFIPNAPRIVHADGIVMAITWYQDSQDINLIDIRREKTGEYETGYSIKLFKNQLNLYNRQSPYELSDIEERSVHLALWKNYELPIEIVLKKYYKVEYNKYVLSEDEAQEKVKEILFKRLEKNISKSAIINNKKIEFEKVSNDTIRGNALLECIEEIGYKEEITESKGG